MQVAADGVTALADLADRLASSNALALLGLDPVAAEVHVDVIEFRVITADHDVVAGAAGLEVERW